jgi:hypothetical protein
MKRAGFWYLDEVMKAQLIATGDSIEARLEAIYAARMRAIWDCLALPIAEFPLTAVPAGGTLRSILRPSRELRAAQSLRTGWPWSIRRLSLAVQQAGRHTVRHKPAGHEAHPVLQPANWCREIVIRPMCRGPAVGITLTVEQMVRIVKKDLRLAQAL